MLPNGIVGIERSHSFFFAFGTNANWVDSANAGIHAALGSFAGFNNHTATFKQQQCQRSWLTAPLPISIASSLLGATILAFVLNPGNVQIFSGFKIG